MAAMSLIAAAAVGCTSTGSHPGTPVADASSTAPSLIPPSPTFTFALAAAAAGTAANREAADQAAAAMLAAYVPPAGARPAPSGPADMTGEATGPTTQWVERSAWWALSGNQASEQRLLSAEIAKALPDPQPGSGDFFTSAGGVGVGLWAADEEVFVDTVNFYREQLCAEVGQSAAGKTMLRVDAVVTYLPGRTAAENIAGAGSVTVTAYVAGTHSYPAPVPGESRTVTDRSEVTKVAAVINSQPTASGAPRSCPQDYGNTYGLWLDFRPERAGRPEYRVDIYSGSCADTSVTVDGVLQPDLVAAPIDPILVLLGVSWDLTSAPAPVSTP